MYSIWSCTLSLLLGFSGFQVDATPVPPPNEPTLAQALQGEGVNPEILPLVAAPPRGNVISRSNWTVTCDSFEPGHECNLAIDGNQTTFWQTASNVTPNPPPPHTITVDMHAVYNVNGISNLPRQDGNANGWIARHQVFLSTDGVNWGTPVAYGNWYVDSTTKYSNVEPRPARYVRLVALTEGHGNPLTTIAELNVYQAATFTPPANGIGLWGPTIDFPIVPVAAALEPISGKVLVWSSYLKDAFTNGPNTYTLTSTFDPATGTITQRNVTNVNHDMFCPGISLGPGGRVIVTGGNTAPPTSLYDPISNSWISGHNMVVPRGYQASATTSDGRIFTIGGSFSGGDTFLKNGEIYDPAANTWTMMPNTHVAPMLTKDSGGAFRSDNHAWLFGWKHGTVFQGGPSSAMNWYTPTGLGGTAPAGLRGNDPDAMCGNAIMYDAVHGKILTVGGSPNYGGSAASNAGHIITIGAPNTTAQVVQAGNGMWFSRTFHTSAVLPDGTVFITGGQSIGQLFQDTNAQLTPELYNPTTNRFIKQQPNSIVRVYHHISLLLPDATVLNGGGGLCGTCSTNHFDAQIFTPQYLLTSTGQRATRPSITSISASSIVIGGKITFKTNASVTGASLIRYGSSTHSVNTDQRRIPLTLSTTATNTYTFTVPSDPGIAIPGYWMLFALNSAGVPSVAKTLKITLT